MGLLSCFTGPSADMALIDSEVMKLTAQLAAARSQVSELRSELLAARAQREQAQPAKGATPVKVPFTPTKADASTDVPATVSVAVQAKPPVNEESRIPRPVGDGTAGGAEPATAASGAATSDGGAPAADGKDRLSGGGACLAGGPASPRCAKGPLPSRIPPHPAGGSDGGAPAAAEQGGDASLAPSNSAGSTEVLQQQLKVAEAMRLSLEAQLRDARFANSTLQTQLLAVQTKLEKAVEEQVEELERRNRVRREGQEESHKEIAALRQQLAVSAAARTALQADAEAAARKLQAADGQLVTARQQLETATTELDALHRKLAAAREENASLAAQLQAARERAAQAEERSQQLEQQATAEAKQHQQAATQLEAEPPALRTLDDSTPGELLALRDANDEMARHELHELSANYAQLSSGGASPDAGALAAPALAAELSTGQAVLAN